MAQVAGVEPANVLTFRKKKNALPRAIQHHNGSEFNVLSSAVYPINGLSPACEAA
nr:MAG TPA: hypothetical protein [Caudoviricetes sp.]